MNIKELVLFIRERWQFTPANYPTMSELPVPHGIGFAVAHIAHHMSKSLGKISAECEKNDHCRGLDKEVLKEAAVKMLINSIRLASQINMSAEEIESSVREIMEAK